MTILVLVRSLLIKLVYVFLLSRVSRVSRRLKPNILIIRIRGRLISLIWIVVAIVVSYQERVFFLRGIS